MEEDKGTSHSLGGAQALAAGSCFYCHLYSTPPGWGDQHPLLRPTASSCLQYRQLEDTMHAIKSQHTGTPISAPQGSAACHP